MDRVPTRTWKPEKMGSYFPVREKSGNFEQTGKVRENHTKYWKTEINWDKYYLTFLVIFKWAVQYLLKWIKFWVKKNKTLKIILEKWQKILEKSGNLSVWKSGNPELDLHSKPSPRPNFLHSHAVFGEIWPDNMLALWISYLQQEGFLISFYSL